MSNLVTIIENDAKKISESVDLGELSGKKLLLTGASGLLGTYFLASIHSFFENKKDRPLVHAVMHNDPPQHLEYFLKNVEILSGDITDEKFLSGIPKVDYIIHAAGYGQPGRFMENQVKTLEINTVATLSLFKKLLPQGKFLFLSSSEVYSGRRGACKETEIGTTNTTHPRSCYIEGKRAGEAICNAYRSNGVLAKSARLALAYGPGTKAGDKRVLNNFIFKALNGKIDLLDSGTANRTYCYVADAVEILLSILLKGKEPIYNVGGKSKITIADLARKIGSLTGAEVVFPKESPVQALSGAPDEVSLDMSLVQNEFGKQDYLPLDEGLERTIEWQKALYEKK